MDSFKRILPTLFTLLTLIAITKAYSTGAQCVYVDSLFTNTIFDTMCSNEPLNLKPYAIRVTTTTYTPNQPLNIVVSSTNMTDSFEGLYCYGSVGPSLNASNIAGRFNVPSTGFKLTNDPSCPNFNFSVTHNSKDSKYNGSFVWIAPAVGTGTVNMNCLLVYDREFSGVATCDYQILRVVLNEGAAIPSVPSVPIAPSVRPTTQAPIEPAPSSASIYRFGFCFVFLVLLSCFA
eukprot:TRINITY_DN10247_c0_g1_i1.p1 TRINITY_DN10247_c0_g1~~TRINITY_DN10247_c0_g1_i1.p1  ORF type:complete len:233 (+),score=36.60 TRINITY_DN10247_c0_g1_i1:59-757(+)